jgi:hypothetical protein
MTTGLRISRIISNWTKECAESYPAQRLIASQISGMRIDSAITGKQDSSAKGFAIPFNFSSNISSKKRLCDEIPQCRVFYTLGDTKLHIARKLTKNSILGDDWRITNYIQLTRPLSILSASKANSIKEGEEVELKAEFDDKLGLHILVNRIDDDSNTKPLLELPKTEYSVD